MSKTVSNFEIIFTAPDTVTVDEDGIPNTVFVNRATLVPSHMRKEDRIDEKISYLPQKWHRLTTRPDDITTGTVC